MSDKPLKPYFCYDYDPHESGCVLVFDYDIRSAKPRGYNGFPYRPERYIDFRCYRAKDEYMFFAESDKPHVVDSYEGDYETWDEALKELSITQQLENKADLIKSGRAGVDRKGNIVDITENPTAVKLKKRY